MPFNIGDKVIARIPATWLIPDPDRTEASGTVVESQGGVIYSVLLDEPMTAEDGRSYDTISSLGEDFLRPADP